MLSVLLKKQMSEIFRTYFYDPKKNTRRSAASTALLFLLYGVLMIVVLGGMFTGLSFVLASSLCPLSLDWMYFALMALLAVLLGVFGSVFSTYSGLYLARDNDLLLSLPIPVRTIMASRLASVYLMGLLYSWVVMLPAVIVYWFFSFSVPAVAGGLVMLVLLSLLVLILSCVLGYAVALISRKLKYKSFVTVLVSLLFLAAYYVFYFRAQAMLSELIAHAAEYGEKIRRAAYPVYLLGRAGTGDWLAMLILTAAVLALLALTWTVLARSFLRIATSSGASAGKKTARAPAPAKMHTPRAALFSREMARFTSSPNYMLNCGLGTLLLPLSGAALLWKGGVISEVLDGMFGARPGAALVILVGAVCLIASMNDMAAPSVSLEGKNLWLVQSLPVTPGAALRAKLSVQLVLTAPAALFCTACALIVLRPAPLEAVLALLCAAAASLLLSAASLWLGLLSPNLTWTSEIVPIKQSMSVMIALLGGWAYGGLFVGAYLLGGHHLGAAGYLCAALGVTAAGSAVLCVWIARRGAKIFASL